MVYHVWLHQVAKAKSAARANAGSAKKGVLKKAKANKGPSAKFLKTPEGLRLASEVKDAKALLSKLEKDLATAGKDFDKKEQAEKKALMKAKKKGGKTSSRKKRDSEKVKAKKAAAAAKKAAAALKKKEKAAKKKDVEEKLKFRSQTAKFDEIFVFYNSVITATRIKKLKVIRFLHFPYKFYLLFLMGIKL
jgi:hypothetical protein